jgi:hypothetical protein
MKAIADKFAKAPACGSIVFDTPRIAPIRFHGPPTDHRTRGVGRSANDTRSLRLPDDHSPSSTRPSKPAKEFGLSAAVRNAADPVRRQRSLGDVRG